MGKNRLRKGCCPLSQQYREQLEKIGKRSWFWKLLGGDRVSDVYINFVKMHAYNCMFTSCRSMFINTLMFRLTGNDSLVMRMNMLQFAFTPFAYTIGAHFIRKHSLPKSARVGMIFSLLLYLTFFAGMQHLELLVPLLAAINAASFGFYALANQAMTVEYSSDATRDTALSMNGVISGAISMIFPVINGWVISVMPGIAGYYLVFGIAGIIAFFALHQSRKLPELCVGGEMHFLHTLKTSLKNKAFLLASIGESFKGVREGVFTFFLNILLFECIQSEFLVGVNTFLVAITSIFGCWLMGRLVRPNNRIRYMVASLSGLLMITVALLFRLNAYTVMLMSVCNSFLTAFTLNASSSMQFYVVSRMPDYHAKTSEYLAIKAFFLAAGRVTGVWIVSIMPSSTYGSVIGLLCITLLQFGMPLCYRIAIRLANQMVAQE